MVATLLIPSFKIIQYVGETTVSAKELYSYLEINEDFQLWGLRTLRQHYETRDYFTEYRHEEDLPFDYFALDHLLTVECAKDISLQQKSKKGRLSYLFLLQLQNSEKKAKRASEEAKEQAKKRWRETSRLVNEEFKRILEQNGWIGCITDLSCLEFNFE